MRSYTIPTAFFTVLFAPLVFAQGAERSAIELPKGCEAAAQSAERMKMPEKQQTAMPMGEMTATQQGLHQAMKNMEPAMMKGVMAKDADVAWICAMIPHHQGAIDMARAGLKGADNPESKRMAEETIKMQEKEIAKLVAWVDKHASTESKDEKGAPSKK